MQVYFQLGIYPIPVCKFFNKFIYNYHIVNNLYSTFLNTQLYYIFYIIMINTHGFVSKPQIRSCRLTLITKMVEFISKIYLFFFREINLFPYSFFQMKGSQKPLNVLNQQSVDMFQLFDLGSKIFYHFAKWKCLVQVASVLQPRARPLIQRIVAWLCLKAIASISCHKR